MGQTEKGAEQHHVLRLLLVTTILLSSIATKLLYLKPSTLKQAANKIIPSIATSICLSIDLFTSESGEREEVYAMSNVPHHDPQHTLNNEVSGFLCW
jgi:hypothetical protein